MIGTSKQKFQIGLYTFSLVLATAGLVCRLWARRLTRTKLQINDWLMVLAYLNVLGLVIAANLCKRPCKFPDPSAFGAQLRRAAVTIGQLGVEQNQMSKAEILEALPFNLKMTIVVPIFLVSSSFLVKMSITHFYITIFPNTTVQLICRLQLLLLCISYTASVIPCFLVCRPLNYTWNQWKYVNVAPGAPGMGQCFDIKNLWLGTSIVALFFDVACVILPIPVVWTMTLETWKKIRLIVLFGLGFFICALTIGRIYYESRIKLHDIGYTAAPAIMFTVPEPSLGVVAGSIPVMMPLFRDWSQFLKSRFPSFTFPAILPRQPKSRSGSSSFRWPTLKSWHTSTTAVGDDEKHFVGTKCRKRGTGSDMSEDIVYPMTSVTISRYSGEEDFEPPVMGTMCLEQLRATEEMMRNCGLGENGITVLREVTVEHEPREI